MNKRIRAEYDAASRTLRLVEPLDGIEDRQQVFVAVEEAAAAASDWRRLRGTLPAEAAEEMRRHLIDAREDEV